MGYRCSSTSETTTKYLCRELILARLPRPDCWLLFAGFRLPHRASEASQSVFGQACFALELSMQKQEQLLKEDPFLCDANWNLVWRYVVAVVVVVVLGGSGGGPRVSLCLLSVMGW